MPDYFTLLNATRRPWLEADEVKQKFITLSATVHPDRIHSASSEEKTAAARLFAELNTAQRCLADHKLRLLHLLELELGSKPRDIQSIPNNLADLFTGVATACRDTDGFLAEKAKATSPLLQVAIFERGMEWVEQLQKLQQNLNIFHQKLLDELRGLDGHWMNTPMTDHRQFLPQLEELYRLFGYFNRWNNQIQERIVQLSF